MVHDPGHRARRPPRDQKWRLLAPRACSSWHTGVLQQATAAWRHGPARVTPFRAVADATDLPRLPLRHSRALRHTDRDRHPHCACRASPDRGREGRQADLFAATKVMAATDLAWYSGTTCSCCLTSPRRGWVSSGSPRISRGRSMPRSSMPLWRVGDRKRSRSTARLIAVADAVMNTSQGAIMAKAGSWNSGSSSMRRCACRSSRAHRNTSEKLRTPGSRLRASRDHPHPDLGLPAPLTENGVRVVPLGGLGEVGQHDHHRARRAVARRRLRRALPGRRPPRGST